MPINKHKQQPKHGRELTEESHHFHTPASRLPTMAKKKYFSSLHAHAKVSFDFYFIISI